MPQRTNAERAAAIKNFKSAMADYRKHMRSFLSALDAGTTALRTKRLKKRITKS